jgi:hypothetical protein
MGRDAGECIFEPGGGIDADPLTRCQKAAQYRGGSSPAIAANKVVAANSHTAYGALGVVIVDLQISVVAEAS